MVESDMVFNGEEFRDEFVKYQKRRNTSEFVLADIKVHVQHQGNFTIVAIVTKATGEILLGCSKRSTLDNTDIDIGRKIAFWRALDDRYRYWGRC